MSMWRESTKLCVGLHTTASLADRRLKLLSDIVDPSCCHDTCEPHIVLIPQWVGSVPVLKRPVRICVPLSRGGWDRGIVTQE